MEKRIVAIDVEASSFDGYIIELGWADSAGASDGFLVRPAGDPDTWKWNDDAERVHRIPFRTVCEQGVNVKLAAQKLAAACEGAIVCSNAAGYEYNWLVRLYQQAEMEIPPAIAGILDYSVAAMARALGERGRRYSTAEFERCEYFRALAREALQSGDFKAKHRAKDDAIHTLNLALHCQSNWEKFREQQSDHHHNLDL